MKKITASIIIPTRNAGQNFKLVLDMIFAQSRQDFELIIIDTDSKDGTLDLLKNYNIVLKKITQNEFGHGKTRNLGVSLASGEYVVFLTQDALPENRYWLQNLLSSFDRKDIAGTFGRQVPRGDENILDKFFFLTLYSDQNILWTKESYSVGDNIFSDANSAVRRKLLLKYPYKEDIIVSEDYEWAAKMLNKGYKIFYNKDASVIHSHSYDLPSLFKRNFDIGVSYKEIYKNNNNQNFFKKGFKIYFREIQHYIFYGKAHLIPMATIRDLIRYAGVKIGKKEHLFIKEIKKNYLSAQTQYWI